MSNARSPRDVCSTTIGTRGLIVLALFRFLGSNPAGAAERFRPVRWGESSNRHVAACGGADGLRRAGEDARASAQALLEAALPLPLAAALGLPLAAALAGRRTLALARALAGLLAA